MTKTTRPFVHSLQSLLQLRLPADEYRQIMEESLWEFEKLLEDHAKEASIRSEDQSRFCSLCISFFRAMLSVGMERQSAAGTIADAFRDLDWTPVPVQATESCSLAAYFDTKDALTVCEAAFCSKCPRHEGCPCLAELKALRLHPR